LAPEAGLWKRAGDLFLVGMFSRLDAMLGRPLDELLEGLKLQQDIQGTLLDAAPPGDALATIWRLVLAYEAADWERLAKLAGSLGVPTQVVSTCYAAAVQWSDKVFQC
jgi:EAL and modified HD-GYP domain-containing signal transduction protein